MNSQERDQLSQFLRQLGEVKLTEKDHEAESLIREAVTRQPDAAYLLVQRALLLEQALNNAKARIDELQIQVQNNQTGQKGGFFGNDPWAQPAGNSAPVPGVSNYQVPRYAAQSQPQQPQASAFGGGGSFLGNIATTAAGVVAGSFLFQGIESLMGGHGHHGGGNWSQPWNDGGEHASEQTVINNYYGDDAMQMADQDHDKQDYLVSDDFDDYQGDDNSGDSGWI